MVFIGLITVMIMRWWSWQAVMVVGTSWVFLRRWRWGYSRKPAFATCDKLKAVLRTRLVLISQDDSPQIWNRNVLGWNSGAKESFLSIFHPTFLFVFGVMKVKDVTGSLIIENRKIFLLCVSKSWSCCTNMHVAHKGQSKADWLHFKWKLLQEKLWRRIFFNTK